MNDLTLTMIFTDSQGNKAYLRINNTKPNLTKNEVKSVMDAIITANVFESKTGLIRSKYSAIVVERDVIKLDIQY